MSLARRAAMPALWAEITEAVAIGGPKALQIAFYEVTDLPGIMRVLEANKEAVGAAGALLEAARLPNTGGRERPVMHQGPALELLRRYTVNCADLTRGVAWDDMAEMAGLSPYDMRLRPLCKAISKAAFRAWGMELGWYGGRFRVLTAKQAAEKETKLLEQNVRGGIKRNEVKRKPALNQDMTGSNVSYQGMLFEGVIGETDDLPN